MSIVVGAKSQEILSPNIPKTAKRPYKKRETNYLLSSRSHRENKLAKLTEKEDKAKKKSNIRANVDPSSLNLDETCKFCHSSLKEDENDKKKRKVSWLLCCKCKTVMHVKCVPKRVKQQNPYLASRIVANLKFDYKCC